MDTFIKLPFYAKVSLIFIGLSAFISMLYVAQNIIVPVIYAIILAIVLSPIVDFFIKLRFGRILSIALTLVLVLSFAFAVILFLCSQAGKFGEAFPTLVTKFNLLVDQSVVWASDTFHISTERLNKWLQEMRSEMVNSGKSAIGVTLIYTGNALVILVLIPVYVFMILYYKPLLLEFVHRLFRMHKRIEVNEVLISTKKIVQSYLVGLMIEAAIIATLQSTTLLILGIEYALLLGVIGAILNIVPYIGGILGALIPCVLALTTQESFSKALMVVIAYAVIQFIDNHYVVPKVVASKVKINALVSVIVVLAGSALWGFPGMLISIPLTAIIKVICDHIEDLQPWGFLLGDTMPPFVLPRFNFRRRLKTQTHGK